MSVYVYLCVCLFSYSIYTCCELNIVAFGLTVVLTIIPSFPNQCLLMIPVIPSLLSPYVSISACISVCLSSWGFVFFCVSASRLGNLLGLRYDRTGQDCGKEKSLQDIKSSFVLACDALCWCNLRSAFSISWLQLLLHC